MKKEDTILIIAIVGVLIALGAGAYVIFGGSGEGGGALTPTSTPENGQSTRRTPESIVEETLGNLSSSGIPTRQCESVNEREVREQCYIYNAVQNKTAAPCGRITGDEFKRYTCYVSVASITKDSGLCANVPNNGWRAYCERGVANAAND